MQPVLQRAAHQRVIAGMELHLVDAMAETIMHMQHRRMLVRQPRMHLHLGTAGLGAQRVETCAVVARVMPGQRFLQRQVQLEQVHVGQRRGLVEDFVGEAHEGLLSIWTWGMWSSRYSSPTGSKPRSA